MSLSKHELLYISVSTSAIKKATEVAFSEFLLRGMSYPSCPYQAAMLNCESFAFTLICFCDRVERPSML
jgi:hypothetical protein